jgi:hypothetical protein
MTTRAPIANQGLIPQNLAEARELCKDLIDSDVLPKNFKPGTALALIIAGHELGLTPMSALRNLYIGPQNTIGMKADFMVGLIKRRKDICKYFTVIKESETSVTCETLRIGDPNPIQKTFSMDDAKRAGLLNKGFTWGAYPSTMLRHRCASSLARQVYPDVLAGCYEDTEIEEMRVRETIKPVSEVFEYVDTPKTSKTATQILNQRILEGKS